MGADVSWDPGQYAHFATQRLRPAFELLARVDHPDPRVIHDLGTGRGEIARHMAERWPDASVTGSDVSDSMLTEARALPSRVQWVRTDIRTWQPDRAHDIIYSNAALHWVDDHDVLFPRLVSYLAPAGVLAVQMPLSWDEPSHRLMREVLTAAGPDGSLVGSTELVERLRRRPVADANWYYDLLIPHVDRVDIWQTRYTQVLQGENPVLEWVKGTALRPILENLDPPARSRFLERYASAVRAAYPQRPDGATLFPFPRLFIVATR